MKPRLHINCDLGEGISNDKLIMPLISSCNIACGGHFGDENSMKQAMALAKENGVQIGVHPSYPDRKNFGRSVLKIEASKLKESIQGQIEWFLKIADLNNCEVNHVKPHGALYNEAAKNVAIAQIIVEVMLGFNRSLELYAPYGSVIAGQAMSAGIPIRYEAFADRNYLEDLMLVPRSHAQAMVKSDDIIEHIKTMSQNGKVKSISRKTVPIKADTFCVHGDNKEALGIIRSLHYHFQIL